MFVIAENNMKKPIKVWLENREEIEESCMEQAMNLARLPFLHKWVCLMPDTHTGMGMPIGRVTATDGVIIPNAVGVDIGCGMNFISTKEMEYLERVCWFSWGRCRGHTKMNGMPLYPSRLPDIFFSYHAINH